jgi:hypothetical protein
MWPFDIRNVQVGFQVTIGWDHIPFTCTGRKDNPCSRLAEVI